MIKTRHFHCRGPGVQSLLGELRSRKLRSVAKKKKKKVKELLKLSNKKINHTAKKWAKDVNRYFTTEDTQIA